MQLAQETAHRGGSTASALSDRTCNDAGETAVVKAVELQSEAQPIVIYIYESANVNTLLRNGCRSTPTYAPLGFTATNTTTPGL
ncbi:unnamed protein product [Mycena citricolor]|uniref:Uncharacterized protein n=1 Tax=Mycena citricolor TaxID=2018698 RepID=A0AAD2H186_9AGAR|nr:unnamed protein product [Mycena citricolor]